MEFSIDPVHCFNCCLCVLYCGHRQCSWECLCLISQYMMSSLMIIIYLCHTILENNKNSIHFYVLTSLFVSVKQFFPNVNKEICSNGDEQTHVCLLSPVVISMFCSKQIHAQHWTLFQTMECVIKIYVLIGVIASVLLKSHTRTA